MIENSGDPNCGTNVLASYAYDTLSRRSGLTYGAPASPPGSASYSYTLAGDLTGLSNTVGTGA